MQAPSWRCYGGRQPPRLGPAACTPWIWRQAQSQAVRAPCLRRHRLLGSSRAPGAHLPRHDSHHVKREDVMGGPRAGRESGTWAGSDSSTISSPAVRLTSTISISRCIVGEGRGCPSPSLSSLQLLPQYYYRCRIKKASKSRDLMQAYGAIPKEAAPVQVLSLIHI